MDVCFFCADLIFNLTPSTPPFLPPPRGVCVCKFSLLKKKVVSPPFTAIRAALSTMILSQTPRRRMPHSPTLHPPSCCLLPSLYVSILRGRGGFRPEEGYRGRVDLLRRSCHLPDCWNVNAVALIIGFCTHRL